LIIIFETSIAVTLTYETRFFKMSLISGKPYPPCCLKITMETSISVTLTFRAGFFAGSPQAFTIEYREESGRWRDAKSNIKDPGTDRIATQKITDLREKTRYDFRVYGTNSYGTSDYSNITGTKTDGKGLQITVSASI
jgi:hypothetical protein